MVTSGVLKNQAREWIRGSLNDILVPVEAFHLRTMFQNIINHQERFDYDRIPAVVELCLQAALFQVKKLYALMCSFSS